LRAAGFDLRMHLAAYDPHDEMLAGLQAGRSEAERRQRGSADRGVAWRGARGGRGLSGWGGTVASIVADEGFEFLDAPIRRVAAACVPLPFADALEQRVIPTADRVAATIRALASY
jgi:hypothetical protein